MKQTKMETGQRMTRECSLREAPGEGSRRFELSFSSEEPYERWFGPEILDHSEGAVSLGRLKEIGCVLFNHDTDKPIGRIADVAIKDGRGIAEIELCSPEENSDSLESICKKVESGVLRGVSVGYVVNATEEVKAGAQSTDGRFAGPCTVVRSWEPLEISIVSVPADATVGVGRSMDDGEGTNQDSKRLALCERQLLINKNF